MSDGINISEAGAGFERPLNPPGLLPLDCRCGAKAEEVLDGSLWGCSKCCISGASIVEWNGLVEGGALANKQEVFLHLIESAQRYWQFRHDSDVGFGCEFSGEHPETQLKKAIAMAKGLFNDR